MTQQCCISSPFLCVILKKSLVSCCFPSLPLVRGLLRNAALNILDELKRDTCVNLVKTRRHHLVHESFESQVGLGPPLRFLP